MGKKYNYYDTPSNHPDAVKYQGWESTILIFGIGVVTTLLILSYLFGSSQREADPQQASSAIVVSSDTRPCEPANMIHVQERDRLIQLLSLANDLPIADVMVNELGTVCYDNNGDPLYDVMTDMMVTVDQIPAAVITDYEALGNHITQILPVMMQIKPENPRQVTIRFLVGDEYLEWSHSYNMTNLFTQGLSGEDLWFWVEPEF